MSQGQVSWLSKLANGQYQKSDQIDLANRSRLAVKLAAIAGPSPCPRRSAPSQQQRSHPSRRASGPPSSTSFSLYFVSRIRVAYTRHASRLKPPLKSYTSGIKFRARLNRTFGKPMQTRANGMCYASRGYPYSDLRYLTNSAMFMATPSA